MRDVLAMIDALKRERPLMLEELVAIRAGVGHLQVPAHAEPAI